MRPGCVGSRHAALSVGARPHQRRVGALGRRGVRVRGGGAAEAGGAARRGSDARGRAPLQRRRAQRDGRQRTREARRAHRARKGLARGPPWRPHLSPPRHATRVAIARPLRTCHVCVPAQRGAPCAPGQGRGVGPGRRHAASCERGSQRVVAPGPHRRGVCLRFRRRLRPRCRRRKLRRRGFHRRGRELRVGRVERRLRRARAASA